uniref:Ice-binding protein C-terminal domain-containing protein n=1 Tax=Solibacter usitatus (strain Ellin6076) TaxID=234267 RepID=Q029T2_SOLUE
MSSLGRVVFLVCFCAGMAFGDAVCTTGAEITGPATTFCVSDFGSSNAWYSSNPARTPLPNFNLLGDSEQFLNFTLASGGEISQFLSAFSVITPVTNVSGAEAKSTIGGSNITIDIDSKVINDNIKQTFTITNAGSAIITSMELVEYFHYFPFGSTNPTLGILSYMPVPTLEGPYVLGLWASGPGNGLVRDGGVCGGPGAGPGIGCTPPDHYMIGSPSAVLAAVANTGTTDLPGGQTVANMDSAGALSWRVSGLSLTNGQQQAFTIELVPEPATWAFMLIGGAVLASRRRRSS